MAISINPGVTSWHPKQLVNDINKALRYCGSLLILDEEVGAIHFAHSSVKQFLTFPPSSSPLELDILGYGVGRREAHSTFGEILVTYLNPDVLNKQIIKVSGPSLVPVKHVPSHVLGVTLADTVKASQLARKLLKNRKTPAHGIGRSLEKVRDLTNASTLEPYPLDSLLSYALASSYQPTQIRLRRKLQNPRSIQATDTWGDGLGPDTVDV